MLTPLDLALAYDRYVDALRRGNARDAAAFGWWLAPFWTLEGPPRPRRHADAVGFLSLTSAGLRWYAGDGVVLGYEPNSAGGCYRVPVGVVPPSVVGGRIAAASARRSWPRAES